MSLDAESLPVQLKLMGMFNVIMLCLLPHLLMIGIVLQDIVQGLEQLHTVPGRAKYWIPTLPIRC